MPGPQYTILLRSLLLYRGQFFQDTRHTEFLFDRLDLLWIPHITLLPDPFRDTNPFAGIVPTHIIIIVVNVVTEIQ